MRRVRDSATLPPGWRDAGRVVRGGSMTIRRCFIATVASFVAVWAHATSGQENRAAPVIVVETTRGTFEFETYPEEAPKTVAHIVDLVKHGFYNGQRVHRALPGFLVQWGDP